MAFCLHATQSLHALRRLEGLIDDPALAIHFEFAREYCTASKLFMSAAVMAFSQGQMSTSMVLSLRAWDCVGKAEPGHDVELQECSIVSLMCSTLTGFLPGDVNDRVLARAEVRVPCGVLARRLCLQVTVGRHRARLLHPRLIELMRTVLTGTGGDGGMACFDLLDDAHGDHDQESKRASVHHELRRRH